MDRQGDALGRLWLVPSPLDFGCVADAAAAPPLSDVLPLGGQQVAAGLRHWVVENARTARAVLKRIDASCPLAVPLQQLDMRELPRPRKGAPASSITPENWHSLLAPALAGHDMGLMSEAGLPAIADPGAALVQAAHAAGVPVMPLVGPSSLMLALGASGLNGQSFAFVGYLPTGAAERTQQMTELERHSRRWSQTQIVIETPYRNAALLDALLAGLSPQTWLSVACGLTLPQQSVRTARVAQWRARRSTLPGDVPAVFLFLAG